MENIEISEVDNEQQLKDNYYEAYREMYNLSKCSYYPTVMLTSKIEFLLKRIVKLENEIKLIRDEIKTKGS